MRVEQISPAASALFFRYAKQYADIYAWPEWVSSYGSSIRFFLIKNEKDTVLGGWVAFEKKKWGLKMLITPPFASHCGLFLVHSKDSVFGVQSDKKKVLEAMCTFLQASSYHYIKLDLPVSFDDIQPAIWKGMSYSVKYTYRLDLKRSKEDLWNNLHPNIRRKIEQTHEDGDYAVSHIKEDRNRVRDLFTAALKRTGGKWDDELLGSILSSEALQFSTLYLQKDLVAAALHAGNGTTAFYLFGSNDREKSGTKGGARVIWESILLAKEQGYQVYDFEGSMIEGVEYFFRSFGGTITPTFVLKTGRGLWPRLLSYYFKS